MPWNHDKSSYDPVCSLNSVVIETFVENYFFLFEDALNLSADEAGKCYIFSARVLKIPVFIDYSRSDGTDFRMRGKKFSHIFDAMVYNTIRV